MSNTFLDGGNAYTQMPAWQLDQGGAANPGPVFAPDIATYATRTPYITAEEFTSAGTGVDVSQLVPAGQPGDQTAALNRVIARASSWADNLCYQVLAATLDTQAGLYRVQRSGELLVPVANTPLIAVASVATGPSGADLTPWTDLSQVWMTRKVVHIGWAGGPFGSQFNPALSLNSDGRIYVSVGYVNGWTNTTLHVAGNPGDQQIVLLSPLGVFPGMTLLLADDANTEQVTVSPTYVPGGPSVQLTAPLTNAHAVGVSASAFPESIKQAVISLTACLIKTRGSGSFVMQSYTAAPTREAVSEAGGVDDLDLAMDLLVPFRRVW